MLVGFYIASPDKILMDTTLPYTLSAGLVNQNISSAQHLPQFKIFCNSCRYDQSPANTPKATEKRKLKKMMAALKVIKNML